MNIMYCRLSKYCVLNDSRKKGLKGFWDREVPEDEDDEARSSIGVENAVPASRMANESDVMNVMMQDMQGL